MRKKDPQLGVCFSIFHSELYQRTRIVAGYIAQWLERLTADQQVPGSNPGVPLWLHTITVLLHYYVAAGYAFPSRRICGPPGLWPATQGSSAVAAAVALVGKVGNHAGMGHSKPAEGGPAPWAGAAKASRCWPRPDLHP